MQKIKFYVIALTILLNAMLFIPLNSYAATAPPNNNNTDVIEKVLCNVNNYMTGTAGRLVAFLLIIGIAVAMFMGKIQLQTVIAGVGGLALFFGASVISGNITGTANNCTSQWQQLAP